MPIRISATDAGVEGAGAVAYALWIMTAATLASDLGIPQALLRFAAQEEGERAGVARALRGSVGISAILPAKRFLV